MSKDIQQIINELERKRMESGKDDEKNVRLAQIKKNAEIAAKSRALVSTHGET